MPKLLCVTWYSFDVFFTSSTICHLCMISIDRFMALKYPLKYGGHAKDQRHMILKIAIVWVVSFCIAGPLFVLSMLDKKITVHYKGCGPETQTFVISATVVSFYLPLLIMTVMYALTVDALRQQLREQRRMTVTQSRCTSVESFERGSVRTDAAAAAAAVTVSSSTSNPNDSRPFSPFVSTSGTDVQATSAAVDDISDPLPSTRSKHPRTLSTIGRQRIQVFKFQHKNHLNECRRRGTMKAPDRGRRAVRVLGYLFAVFVVFYLPFFAVYFINGTCARCQAFISGQMITAFEWLQYSGSMLNPIVYHIFNPDFRRAFHKILRCRLGKRPN